jgi:hypothetical protein
MSFQFIQLPPCPLVAFLNETDTSFEVSGFLYNDGITPVDPADIGDICFATLEPRTERAELISFTIDSVTEDGVATVTAVRGLSQKAPYGTGGASFGHQAGSNLVISNNPGLLNKFAIKSNDETITGTWTFAVAPTALGATPASQTVVGNTKLSSKAFTDLGVATITIATPAVISNVGHGLIAGDTVQFTTAGALPTGFVSDVDYFVITPGLTSDNIQLALTPGGAAINTSGTQSGVHTLFRTTPVAVGNDDPRMPTEDAAAAMAGGADIGIPSGSNKFITEEFYSTKRVVRDYTDNATWTKPVAPNFLGIRIEMIGAGAGGGAGEGGSGGGSSGGGGRGGGTGSLGIIDIPEGLLVNATEAIVIGEGGLGNTSPVAYGGTAPDGDPGGDTTFGSLVTAKGGIPGGSVVSTPFVVTTFPVFQQFIDGIAGGGRTTCHPGAGPGGEGADSYYGPGGIAGVSTGNGGDAPVASYGAGGGGAGCPNDGFAAGNGGDGAKGFMRIIELYS